MVNSRPYIHTHTIGRAPSTKLAKDFPVNALAANQESLRRFATWEMESHREVNGKLQRLSRQSLAFLPDHQIAGPAHALPAVYDWGFRIEA